jgi:hypothetical protein
VAHTGTTRDLVADSRSRCAAAVITGSYDPFIDPTHVRRTLSVYRELTFVNIPWAGHNVLGEVQCAIDLRNRWLDDPRATRRCTAGLPAPLISPLSALMAHLSHCHVACSSTRWVACTVARTRRVRRES